MTQRANTAADAAALVVAGTDVRRRAASPPPRRRPAISRELRRLQRRQAERGIILVFVVVLLSLMAILGTAYLATSRADRQAMASNGRGIAPGVTIPQVVNRTNIDQILAGATSRIENQLIEDLFNVQPGMMQLYQDQQNMSPTQRLAMTNNAFLSFRQTATVGWSGGASKFYENYDAPGRADAWLASLLPENSGPNIYSWPWISAPISGEPRNGGDPLYGSPVARQILSGVDLEPFFADPRLLRNNGFSNTYASQVGLSPALEPRHDVRITALALTRDMWQSSDQTRSNNRLYPAFSVQPTAGPTRTTFIAGDADGDGIADCGLMPVVVNPSAAVNSSDRYIDVNNNVIYFVGYRIVDNSAQINMSTALSVQGDFVPDAAGAVFQVRINKTEDMAANPELRNAVVLEDPTVAGRGFANGPNLGFFQSNVGLVELFREQLRPYVPATGSNPAIRDLFSFVDVRLPLLSKAPRDDDHGKLIRAVALANDPYATGNTGIVMPVRMEGERNTNTGTDPIAYEYRSFGDLLQQQVTNTSPGAAGTLWYPGSAATLYSKGFVPLPEADGISLAQAGGALLNDRITPAAGESSLALSLRMAAPNYSTSSEPTWKWFPPDQVEFWYNWTKAFNVTDPASGTIGFLDSPPADDTRVFIFPTITGMTQTPQRLPKSIRSLLTTYSGVTANVPVRRDTTIPLVGGAATLLPPGMPSYGGDLANNQYPASRVSAATGTKEQLWRAYWSMMTEQNTFSAAAATTIVKGHIAPASAGSPPDNQYNAFKPTDRHPSAIAAGARLTDAQMALIRSAVAACNTVDLRDNDQDITAMTVDLGDTPGAGGTRLFARVYGTEKQLVISAVVIDQPGINAEEPADPTSGLPAGPSIYVEIFNPSDEAIDLTAYRIAIVDRNSVAGKTLADPLAKVGLAPSLGGSGQISLLPAGYTGSTLLLPGGHVILTNRGEADPPPAGIKNEKGEDGVGFTPVSGKLVVHGNILDLEGLKSPSTPHTRELALLRTRRADGVATTEDPALANNGKYPRQPFSENTTAAAQVMTLVPVDGVDCRSLGFTNLKAGNRYIYVRHTADDAWRCFYAGSFYDQRPIGAGSPDPQTPPPEKTFTVVPPPTPPTPPTVTVGSWAWREYPLADAGGPPQTPDKRLGVVTLGAQHTSPGVAAQPTALGGETLPFIAPTIPIQNFKPYSPDPVATPNLVQSYHHPANKFPFGSPFARDGDLLTVPFIGTYKIYRANTPLPATPAPDLYEYVPLPMDAAACDNLDDRVKTATEDPTAGLRDWVAVGRFDVRSTVGATPATAAWTNNWADNLFDFVTARQSPVQRFFPDVPRTKLVAAAGGGGRKFNDPADVLTDQDGPIIGADPSEDSRTKSGPGDPAFKMPWVAFLKAADVESGSPTVSKATSSQREAPLMSTANAAGDTGNALLPGIINLNTAPAIVRRMLPLAVDTRDGPEVGGPKPAGAPGGGRVVTDNIGNTATNAARNQRVAAAAIDDYVESLQMRDQSQGIFGITSLGVLNAIPGIANTATLTTEAERMRAGDLQPFHRPAQAVDFVAANREMTRVSNLASTRSDVFTVYVTVQAWTWMGTAQATDTRLIGEVRKAYIVDRSAITQQNFLPTALIRKTVDQQ